MTSILFSTLFCYSQEDSEKFKGLIIDSISLPEHITSPIFSLDVHEPDLILMPYYGGILDIVSKNWIVPPNDISVIKSFKYDKSDDSFYGILNGPLDNYLIISNKTGTDTLMVLEGNRYRIYEDNKDILVSSINESGSELIHFEYENKSVKNIYSFDIPLNELIKLEEMVLLLMGNKITALDLTTNQLKELAVLENEAWGILDLDDRFFLVSQSDGIIAFDNDLENEIHLISTKKIGSLSSFMNNILFHSYLDNKIYILDKIKIRSLIDKNKE